MTINEHLRADGAVSIKFQLLFGGQLGNETALNITIIRFAPHIAVAIDGLTMYPLDFEDILHTPRRAVIGALGAETVRNHNYFGNVAP
eukprot:CAMPEP_0194519032 /NCGR_PEP_ID=MMETSP0253-20130528/52579_1 /TAXON_ID=2966 /ORGANISM="Noctiluca scintillans" /LENGTH=87 /DNA_ID=CAMNT_0039363121 /DNA_START=477 /DNA_END=740 /DNA_ORIENTATION=+